MACLLCAGDERSRPERRPERKPAAGAAITEVWAAETVAGCGFADPALYDDGGVLLVVIGSRDGAVIAYDGDTGEEVWNTAVPGNVDGTPTIDPANGNVYVGAGDGDIYVVGLGCSPPPL